MNSIVTESFEKGFLLALKNIILEIEKNIPLEVRFEDKVEEYKKGLIDGYNSGKDFLEKLYFIVNSRSQKQDLFY
ncbi:hypothetical protein BKN14_02070 [Candidatus Gracilibacteria bacterium HOT-871]|jgi:hypothetical protein|nr:hypothetical protein BKN14_02070 [Candidatus Gracilibacteria bacterium HOT-871]MBF0913770.1 hypothetical protein [Candidatus Gracilibacteria bacterium]